MPLIRRVDDVPESDAAWEFGSREGLIAILSAGTPLARRHAARELARHPETAAALAARLRDEPDATVRDAILTTLIEHRSQAAVAGLLPYLRSQDAALRNAVIEALQTMPGAIEPYVDDMLSDPDSDVRIFMVNVLAELPHRLVPVWLERVVRCDPQVNVCATAIDALAEAGNASAEPALAAASERFPDEPFIAYAAQRAARRIRGQ